jgi:acyl carrier protein
MDDVTKRLIKCFQVVFPGLPESQVPAASQEALESWDSVATVTLANVVEEEFSIPMDFDRLAELNSFETVREWVLTETRTA